MAHTLKMPSLRSLALLKSNPKKPDSSTRSSSRNIRPVYTLKKPFALSTLWVIPGGALAQKEEPCDQLEEVDLDRYNALGDAAAERYGKKDYPGAVEAILEPDVRLSVRD